MAAPDAMQRYDVPSTVAVASPGAATTETDLELQRLLELSRATREMQRLQEAELRQQTKNESTSPAGASQDVASRANGRGAARTPPPAASGSGRTPPPPTRTPPSGGGQRRPGGSRQGSFRPGRAEDEDRPRPPPVPQGTLRQQGQVGRQNVTPVRGSTVEGAQRRAAGANASPASSVGRSPVGGATEMMRDTTVATSAGLGAQARRRDSTSSAGGSQPSSTAETRFPSQPGAADAEFGGARAIEPPSEADGESVISEQDMAWEEELRRSLGAQLREMENRRRAAEKRVGNAQQAIRRLRLDQGKFEKLIVKEKAEAEGELESIEKKAAGQARALRISVDKAETALDAAMADRQEAERYAELAESTKRAELQELYDQKDREEQLNANLACKTDIARSQHQAVEELLQKRLAEVAMERSELQSLGASINEAEEALDRQLQSEFKQEAALLRERTTSGRMERCRGLVETLEAERSRAEALEADIQRGTARFRQLEAEFAGFQQAVDLSVETSTKHLRDELQGLRQEEDLALKHLEALRRQHIQSAAQGLLHPSKNPYTGVDINTMRIPENASRGKLQSTTQAVVAELSEHRNMVSRLFEESSAVATHANTACALQLSGNSPSRSSSAFPPSAVGLEASSPWKRGASATSLFAMPVNSGPFNDRELDGYPWLQHQGFPVAVPSMPGNSQGISRDLADNGSSVPALPLATPAGIPGLAGIANDMPRSLADAKDVASRHLDQLAGSTKTEIERLGAKQEAERKALEASAHAAQGACSVAAIALRRAEASRWMAEAELLRLRAEGGFQAREGFGNTAALAAAAQRAEAKASAAESEAMAAEAAHGAAVRRAAVAGSAGGCDRSMILAASSSDFEALQAAVREGKELPLNDVTIGSLLAFTAKLEVQFTEAAAEDEALRKRHAAVVEVCKLRESEIQANCEVAAASSELEEWQRSLQVSWQNLHRVRNDSHRLDLLRSEVEEEEQRLQQFCRDEEVAEVEHRAWASSQEAALQAKVEAAHVANIEALMTLDARLDREVNLRTDLKKLISSRESWEKKEVGQAMVQSSLAESASLRTSEGNELQKVYANRAKEVERLYSKHGEMLNEHRQLQADLAAARADLRSTSAALVQVQNREVNEAATLRSELFAQESLERHFARATQASSAANAQYSKELAVFQGERKQFQLLQQDYDRIVEEQRRLHDELVTVREECARGWRRLDEEEANHLLHTEQLEERRREQATEAMAAATAAASDAIEAMRLRVAATSSQRGQTQRQCEDLASELREAQQNCASLRRLLERSERVHEQPRERLQRSLAGLSPILSDGQGADLGPEEDDSAAELAAAQAASAKASDAAFQSAGAVTMAEEEVSKLLNRLLAARAECSERAQGLTLAAEEIERTRMEHRRAESELEIIQREISVLQKRASEDLLPVGRGLVSDSKEGSDAAERVRLTETLPREQMILLQHLRGSQRGGGPGSSGNGAMEALRNLREQQLHQATALKAEEDQLCSRVQHRVEDAAREAATAEQLFQHELEVAVVDREQLLAMVENGQEARQTAEQQLRWAIQCLQNSAEASATGQPTVDSVDETMVLRMGTVMREAQRFLYEQQARLEAVQRERDEVKNRLLDTLGHLEGPEYAELVVDTASRAAAATAGLSEDTGPQVYQQALPLGGEAMRSSGRRPRSRSPIPCNLPPTIVEEEEPPKSAR